MTTLWGLSVAAVVLALLCVMVVIAVVETATEEVDGAVAMLVTLTGVGVVILLVKVFGALATAHKTLEALGYK